MPVAVVSGSLLPAGKSLGETQVLGRGEAENERPRLHLALAPPGVPFLLCFGLTPERGCSLF